MKLILHPGHAKCGSTTIQNFLRINRQLLFANKVLVPDINFLMFDEPGVNLVTESPRFFIRQVMTSGDFEKLRNRLSEIRERYSGYTLIVSAENLTNSIEENGNGRKIHNVFSEFFEEISLVYYIRSQDCFLLSAWQQWGFKTGQVFLEYMKRAYARRMPNYMQSVKLFEKIYQRENISVTFLDRDVLHDGDLISDFLYRTNLPNLEFKKSNKNENLSLNPYFCEYLSGCSGLFPDVHNQDFKRFLEKNMNGDEELFFRHDSYFPTERRIDLLDKFSDDNEYIFTSYMKELDYKKIVYKHLDKISNDSESRSFYLKSAKEKLTPLINAFLLNFKSKDNSNSFVSNEKFNVRLVAVAKDEGPYLAYWVFHHLFFGFDTIHIFINRTTDSSIEVLEAINRIYPQVTYEVVDWVDLCPENVSGNIQQISYAKALNDCREYGQVSHLCFLDIDEFWMSESGKYSIHDCLHDFSGADVISFEWACELGGGEPFVELKKNNVVVMNSLVKSVFNINSEIKKIRLHVSKFSESSNIILANGVTFKSKEKFPQQVEDSLSGLKKYFIIHRMYRSEIEYVSTLLRGNPEQKTDIKLNRAGFVCNKAGSFSVGFSNSTYNKYSKDFSDYLDKIAVDNLVASDRAYVKTRYLLFLIQLPLLLHENQKAVLRVLEGVSDLKLIKIVDCYLETKSDIGLIIKKSVSLEKNGDFLSAFSLISLAKNIRPHGPVVNRIYRRCRSKLDAL